MIYKRRVICVYKNRLLNQTSDSKLCSQKGINKIVIKDISVWGVAPGVILALKCVASKVAYSLT